jgi:hypothetical protein
MDLSASEVASADFWQSFVHLKECGIIIMNAPALLSHIAFLLPTIKKQHPHSLGFYKPSFDLQFL